MLWTLYQKVIIFNVETFFKSHGCFKIKTGCKPFIQL